MAPLVRVILCLFVLAGVGCSDSPPGKDQTNGAGDVADARPGPEASSLPAGIAVPATVAAGSHATCAVRDGQVWCWGGIDGCRPETASGLPKPVAGLDDVVHVAVGARMACAVRNTLDVICWPLDSLRTDGSQLPLPLTLVTGVGDVIALSVGSDACAVDSQGKLRCWLLDEKGALLGPDYVDLPGPATEVAVGNSYFACAVTLAGEVLCWNTGQWDVGPDETNYNVSAEVLDISITGQHVAVSASGWSVSNAEGDVAYWNDEPDGPDAFFVKTPAGAPDSPMVALRGGSHEYCARYEDGTTLCWTTARGPTEAVAPWPSPLVAVAIGANHRCGQTESGDVLCMGSNDLGQLGLGGQADTVLLTESPWNWPGEVASLATGPALTCLVDGAADLRCWGRKGGVPGEPLSRPEPDTQWVRVASGGDFLESSQLCALDAAEQLWCADLSDDDEEEALSWSALVLPRTPRELALGDGRKGCALTADGPPVCWDRAQDAVADLTGIDPGYDLLVCMDERCCAAGSEEGTVCFDNLAATGAETANLQAWPELRATHLAVGDDTTCALDVSGDAWCWGFNGRCGTGQDSTMPTVAQPTLVPLPAKAVALAGGRYFTCALLSDERLACWGELDDVCRYELDGQAGCGIGLQAAPNISADLVAAAHDHLLLGAPGSALYQLGRNQFAEVPGAWPPASDSPQLVSFTGGAKQ